MNQYEITYLTKEDLKEKPLADAIKSLDGKIISALSLGQKQLAYPIKKEKEAYFTTVIFEIEGEKNQELNRKLALKEDVLRYLITSAKITKAPEKLEKPAKAPLKKVSPEKPIEEPPKEEKMPKKLPKIPKPAKPAVPALKKEKVVEPAIESEEERLKELDKKLDELLKE